MPSADHFKIVLKLHTGKIAQQKGDAFLAGGAAEKFNGVFSSGDLGRQYGPPFAQFCNQSMFKPV